jgi:ubiquinone/menaquinone biosynthesis C-methylase UbiE
VVGAALPARRAAAAMGVMSIGAEDSVQGPLRASRAGEEMTTTAHPYEDFTHHAFYRAVNEQLVALANLKPGQIVVDLASGTGALLRPILDAVQAGDAPGQVYAVDNDAGALEAARQQYGDKGITYLVADAGELDSLIERADAVFCANALHMIEDKERIMAAVRKILQPGGIFAFNTTFFEGALPQATKRFYLVWLLKARQLLKSEQIQSTRIKGERVAALRQLTAGQYHRLLEEFGFLVRHLEMRVAEMTMESFEDISQFPDFAGGSNLGVPLAQASSALRRAVAQAFEALDLAFVPRRWLQVVAEREDLAEARRDKE